MELEPGYKQTEAGVIPEDWDVDEIIRCADYVDYRGKTPTKASSGILLLTARNIRAGFIDYEVSREYILSSEYESAMQRGRPRVGDVVITTEAPLGMVASLDRDDVALAQRVIKYRGKNGRLRSAFLKFYFLSPRFQSLLNENSSGSTAKGIKGSVLHRLPVILPPLSEQDSIAGALNDADALVNSLEQLIAKKRDLRQGAIQELFRPNTAWVEESLGHVAEIRDGTHQTPKYVEDGVPFFSVENVTSGDFTNTKFISEAEHRDHEHRGSEQEGPKASPERTNLAPIFHAVAGIVVADHLLICVVSLPDDRQFVHVDSATLKFLDRSIRIRMSVINRNN